MRSWIAFFTVVMLGMCFWPAPASAKMAAPQEEATSPIDVVAQLATKPGSVAVSIKGEILVSFDPASGSDVKVARIVDGGTAEPFPTKEWNGTTNLSGLGYSRVAMVRAKINNSVLTLDLGDDRHAARIVEFNLDAHQPGNVNYIPVNFLTEQSQLAGFVYDWEQNRVMVLDSGARDPSKAATPALLDVAPANGWVRRILSGLPEFMPSKDGSTGLEVATIDVQQDWFYFGPRGMGTLYRVPLSMLEDPTNSADDIRARIEKFGTKPLGSAMTVDQAGNVYIALLDKAEIGVIDKTGKYSTYMTDPRLEGISSLVFGKDGNLYAATAAKAPYAILRIKPLSGGVVGH